MIKKFLIKLFSLSMVCILAISLLSVQVMASTGKCGENVTWEYDSANKMLTISGTGSMFSYKSWNEMPWYYYQEDIETIIIEDGIDHLGTYAFSWMFNLTSVEIPESVTSMGNYVFGKCKKLASIDLPDSLEWIGCNIFDETAIYNDPANWENGILYVDNCLIEVGSLESVEVTVRDNIKIIGAKAFKDCTSLYRITIPDSVTDIGVEAFSGCTYLTYVKLPSNIKSIDWKQFYKCESLVNIEIPQGVESIGKSAFSECKSLMAVELPYGVESIGETAFSYCSNLTKVIMPNTVKTIEEGAFSICVSLDNIYYSGTEEEWYQIDDPYFIYNLYGEQYINVIFNYSIEPKTTEAKNADSKNDVIDAEDKKESSSVSKMMIPVGIAAGVAVVGGAAVIFIKKKKK